MHICAIFNPMHCGRWSLAIAGYCHSALLLRGPSPRPRPVIALLTSPAARLAFCPLLSSLYALLTRCSRRTFLTLLAFFAALRFRRTTLLVPDTRIALLFRLLLILSIFFIVSRCTWRSLLSYHGIPAPFRSLRSSFPLIGSLSVP